ncbi:MAG: hypothetical protein V4631_08665 [Pseudomonadota bacterium]
MRKRFGQALRIGVSAHGLALVKTSRWQGAATELVAEHAFGGAGLPGFEAIAAGVRQLLADAGCAGWSATIVLADDLARLWQVTPPQESSRLADLEAAAAVRFQALYGEAASNWQLAAGWDAAKPFMAAAMPRHLLALLQHAAAEQQVTLVEIVPQFVAGWNQWRGAMKPGAWYGQVQQGVLTLGAIDGGEVRAVRAASLPDGASLEWLGQHVAREALRLNLPAPERLQLSGAAPAVWNSSSGGALACSLLAPGRGAGLPASAQLAATGARA